MGTVTDGLQNADKEVVHDKGKWAGKVDPEISNRVWKYRLRCSHKHQDLWCGNDTDNGKDHAGDQSEANGCMDGLLQIRNVSGTVIFGDDDTGSDAIPLKRPTIRKIRLPEELTAASAELPRKFPTIRESAVLYSCWKRFPQKSGIAKATIRFQMEPSVISFAEYFDIEYFPRFLSHYF